MLMRHLKKYKIVYLLVFLAIITGAIHTSRHFIISSLLQGKPYMPFTEKSSYDDFFWYGARMNRAFNGSLFISDIATYEYKDAPPFAPPLAATLYLPMFYLGKTFINGLILIDFFYPFSFFILFYIIGFLLTRQKWFSFFIAISGALAARMPALFFHFDFRNAIKYLLPFSHLEETLLNKRESVLPNYFILLPAIIFILLAINAQSRKKGYVAGILMGIFSGLLIYTYQMYAIYIGGIWLILFFYFLAIKDYAILKRFLYGGIAGLLVILPYFIWQQRLWEITGKQEFLERFGGEFERKINFFVYKEYILYAVLIVLTYFFGKQNRKEAMFVISSLLAIIIGLNIQLLSGYNLQSDHWISRVAPIGLNITFFMWVYWLWNFLKNRKTLFGVFSIGLILFSIFAFTRTIHAQYLFSKNNYQAFTNEDGDFLNAADWLNKNTEKDSVILTPSLKRNSSIVLLTHNRVYLPHAVNTAAPEEEIIGRAFTLFKILNVKTEHVANLLNTEKNAVAEDEANSENKGATYLFYARYIPHKLDTHFLNTPFFVPNDIQKKFVKLYEEIRAEPNDLFKYRADYLFWGDAEKSIAADFNPENKSWLKKEYENSTIKIYRMLPNKI